MRFVPCSVAACLAWSCFGGLAAAQPLDVTFHTAPTYGRYYPAHVEAVWVVAADGSFQRTLHVWGGRRRSHLNTWVAAHPSSEPLDAITSATLRTDSTQDVTWNMVNTAGETVPDGDYLVRFELADTNSASANRHGEFAFTKSPSGFDATASDATFLDVRIVYTPSGVVTDPPDAGGTEPPAAGEVVVPPDTDAGSEPGSGSSRLVPVGRGYGSPHCSISLPAASGSSAVVPAVALGLVALLVRRRRRDARRARS